MCWFTHEEPYVPYETMVERMIGQISSSSIMFRVVDDNHNPYMNMVMNAI
jgi:hypothetical protein